MSGRSVHRLPEHGEVFIYLKGKVKESTLCIQTYLHQPLIK